MNKASLKLFTKNVRPKTLSFYMQVNLLILKWKLNRYWSFSFFQSKTILTHYGWKKYVIIHFRACNLKRCVCLPAPGWRSRIYTFNHRYNVTLCEQYILAYYMAWRSIWNYINWLFQYPWQQEFIVINRWQYTKYWLFKVWKSKDFYIWTARYFFLH